jgi:tRNA threonylcarbamoyladenosine biosynthesis protein TsaE
MEMIYALGEIDIAAHWLLHQLNGRKVIALHGSMGAGKTTLTAAILHAMGSTDHAASPTFSIINQYQLPAGQKMLHMDWYRLKDEEEALNAGVEDALYSGHLCLVEWPDKASGLLPDNTMHVEMMALNENERLLKLR